MKLRKLIKRLTIYSRYHRKCTNQNRMKSGLRRTVKLFWETYSIQKVQNNILVLF